MLPQRRRYKPRQIGIGVGAPAMPHWQQIEPIDEELPGPILQYLWLRFSLAFDTPICLESEGVRSAIKYSRLAPEEMLGPLNPISADATHRTNRYDEPIKMSQEMVFDIGRYQVEGGDSTALLRRLHHAVVRAFRIVEDQRAVFEGAMADHFLIARVVLRIDPRFAISLLGEPIHHALHIA